jgi:hypothetical protein
MKVYTTIGLYPNGDFKVNGVLDKHLQDHIEYNKKYRPGRVLIVNGKIEYKGWVTTEMLETKLKELSNIKMDKPNYPYQ